MISLLYIFLNHTAQCRWGYLGIALYLFLGILFYLLYYVESSDSCRLCFLFFGLISNFGHTFPTTENSDFY